MSTKRITTRIAGGSAVAAVLACLTVVPANAAPDSAICADTWNNGSNTVAQQDLFELFADGGAGNVIVGLQDDGCILAAHNITRPTFVVYEQSGNAFESAEGGPGDQFWQYAAAVNPVNVVVKDAGKVEPVSQ